MQTLVMHFPGDDNRSRPLRGYVRHPGVRERRPLQVGKRGLACTKNNAKAEGQRAQGQHAESVRPGACLQLGGRDVQVVPS